MCKHRTWLCFGHKKASLRKKRHTHICNALVVCHATHATLRTCMPACINDMNIWSRRPSTTGASAHACNCYPMLCHANPHHVLIPFVGCCFSLLSSPVAPLSLHLLCPFPLPPPLAPPRPLVLVVLSLSLSLSLWSSHVSCLSLFGLRQIWQRVVLPGAPSLAWYCLQCIIIADPSPSVAIGPKH